MNALPICHQTQRLIARSIIEAGQWTNKQNVQEWVCDEHERQQELVAQRGRCGFGCNKQNLILNLRGQEVCRWTCLPCPKEELKQEIYELSILNPRRNGMTTTLTADSQSQASLSVIPEEKRKPLVALKATVAEFRQCLADPEMDDTVKLIAQAEAMDAIERQLKPFMGSVMKAMNSPLGFKTDRPPGGKDRNGIPVQPYSPDTVCRCIIQAMLYGAQVVGNEFNIIAGQCYLTKEFFKRAIFDFPGIANLVLMHGSISKYGEKAMICEAVATWTYNGKPQELKFTKTDALDARIIVNSYATSSPDEIRGKVESKVYRRIYSVLTGMNWDDDSGPKEGVIEGTIIGSIATGQESDPTYTEARTKESEVVQEDISDSDAAKEVLMLFVESLEKASSVNEAKTMAANRRKFVESHPWSEDLKLSTIDSIMEAADDRIANIRSTRGQGSNQPIA